MTRYDSNLSAVDAMTKAVASGALPKDRVGYWLELSSTGPRVAMWSEGLTIEQEEILKGIVEKATSRGGR